MSNFGKCAAFDQMHSTFWTFSVLKIGVPGGEVLGNTAIFKIVMIDDITLSYY